MVVGGWGDRKLYFGLMKTINTTMKKGTDLGKEKYKNRKQEIIQFHQKSNMYLIPFLYFETYDHQMKLFISKTRKGHSKKFVRNLQNFKVFQFQFFTSY